MRLALTDEQSMLREAAAGALARLQTVPAAREALDGGLVPDTWPTACHAGWAGLLVGEEHGGAGLGVFDAMLVLEECGKRLAGAGLLGHLPATLVLARAGQEGDARAAELLADLAAGGKRAAMVQARPPVGDEGWTADAQDTAARRRPAARVTADGTLTGAAGFQPDVAGADALVVAAVDEQGRGSAVLLEAGAANILVEAITRSDASRPLGHVTFNAAPGRILAVDETALAQAWYLAQALLAADALGVCQAMLDLSVTYAKDRHTFGRPIGSYQAVKQQLVEILRHVETTRSLCFYAGLAADERPAELALAASAARFAGAQAADYATRTCIAVHGGIGATWEHDAHLYWRRAQLSRLLLGGVADASDRVAEEILARARAYGDTTTPRSTT